MVIGQSANKPDLKMIRRIKRTLRGALALTDETIITVTQLTCLEEECAPLETVFGLLQPERPQQQYKLHKATDTIDVEDLIKVCQGSGHQVDRSVIGRLFKEF